ncbi:hypothetical protein B0H14DRAFT_1194130 [Mycena olivaceomarginata]|nr:hypothetical protein B0H14DRAFT_1194130 [Mycena olivaceomarginata]
MHRCLGILDVLGLILGELRPAGTPWNLHYDSLGCKYRDLASLARTCRMLRDPALDVLWKAQTLENVFCCFPPGLIEEISEQKDTCPRPTHCPRRLGQTSNLYRTNQGTLHRFFGIFVRHPPDDRARSSRGPVPQTHGGLLARVQFRCSARSPIPAHHPYENRLEFFFHAARIFLSSTLLPINVPCYRTSPSRPLKQIYDNYPVHC